MSWSPVTPTRTARAEPAAFAPFETALDRQLRVSREQAEKTRGELPASDGRRQAPRLPDFVRFAD